METAINKQIEPLLDVKDVMHIFKIRHATVYKWIAEGKLPAPARLSAKASRWHPGQIRLAYDALFTPTASTAGEVNHG